MKSVKADSYLLKDEQQLLNNIRTELRECADTERRMSLEKRLNKLMGKMLVRWQRALTSENGASVYRIK